uniref:Uncharacterized protein n=1 Tax=Sphaerodactylus townsendi TaxID=933632 RepID=A0ACB8EBD7_9SAUR
MTMHVCYSTLEEHTSNFSGDNPPIRKRPFLIEPRSTDNGASKTDLIPMAAKPNWNLQKQNHFNVNRARTQFCCYGSRNRSRGQITVMMYFGRGEGPRKRSARQLDWWLSQHL